VTALPENSPPGYTIRAYRKADRAAVDALGTPVIDWWHAKGPEASLHLVAVHDDAEQVVGHLQMVDQSVPEPSRRPGQCHLSLNVAPEHRRRGIGGTLYARAETFARRRNARIIYTAYFETEEAPAAAFLTHRGFEPLERFCPSYLDLETFDPSRFQPAVERVEAQGIRLRTYAGVGDSVENRLKLHELEELAHATQPFREVEPYVPAPFEKWEQGFVKRDPATIFLAIAEPEEIWVGVVTELEWYFTGVHPGWRARGIATALKVQCIAEAKKRGLVRMETENHEDNPAMLAVNRKLGFVFTATELACVKRLSAATST
jgi:GNAT superfamily N-acetyltransferase